MGRKAAATRRGILMALAMLPLRAWADAALHLLPGQPPVEVSVEAGNEISRVIFHSATGEALRPIMLPSSEVSLVGRLPLAGRDVLLTSFPADKFVTLMVMIGWDGVRTRILGVEAAEVEAAEGPRLSLRMSATPDGQILRLIWQLSSPRGPTLPFHDQWVDMLGFRPQAPLADVATRRPMLGGCQERLSAIRADVAAMLVSSPDQLTLASLHNTGLLDIPHQLALAIGAAAYPSGMADP